MRLISFLFAFYFLSLAVIPCGDEGDCTHTRNKQCTESVRLSHNNDTQHQNELCSPLCMCHCCGGVTIVSAEKFHVKETESKNDLALYTEIKISSLSFSVWQPPKV